MRKKVTTILSVLMAMSSLALPYGNAMAVGGSMQRVSVGASGLQTNGESSSPSISGDGRYVAFISGATNLVAGDSNGAFDAFVYDRQSLSVAPVSQSSNGVLANRGSQRPVISTDGRHVSFSTFAFNLGGTVAGNTNNVYSRDLNTGVTKLVSVSIDDASRSSDGDSYASSISGDGRYVAFSSTGSDVVAGQGPVRAVYVRDTVLGSTVNASSTTSGTISQPMGGVSDSLAMSDDGRYVAFQAKSTNLVTNDTSTFYDIYLKDIVSGIVKRISSGLSGEEGNQDSYKPAISRDGRYVAFVSKSTNFGYPVEAPYHNLYMKDTVTGQLTLVVSGRNVQVASISGNNRYVVFSDAGTTTNEVFRWDSTTNQLLKISDNPNGQAANNIAHLTDNQNLTTTGGNLVSFASLASNLVDADTNGQGDVFVFEVPADITAPTVTPTPDRQPNAAGWYDEDVTVSWTATDPSPSSGTPTTPVPTVAGLEGTHTYTSGQSCDPAGNCATGSVELKIDKTDPTISYALSPAPNGAGWNSDDVEVTFTCDDSIAGIESCTAPVTVGEGKNQTVTGTAVDRAGNVKTLSVVVNVDKTKPTIAYTLSPVANTAGWNKNDVTVTFTCMDQGSLSGVASCSAPVTVSTETAGQNVTGTAVDVAGNSQTATATVKLDKTLPTASNVIVSGLFLGIGNTITIRAAVADTLPNTAISSKVVAAEYYIDSDPGVGNGTAMSVSPNPATTGTATASANVSNLFGQHTVYVRSQDAAGNWSLKVSKTFFRVL